MQEKSVYSTKRKTQRVAMFIVCVTVCVDNWQAKKSLCQDLQACRAPAGCP